mgnify:CR=1 FL=1
MFDDHLNRVLIKLGLKTNFDENNCKDNYAQIALIAPIHNRLYKPIHFRPKPITDNPVTW